MPVRNQTRRSFVRSTGAILSAPILGTFPYIMPNRHRGIPPSDQVNIGLIGCRSRGFSVLRNHLKVAGVNCTAICDIDANVLQEKAAMLAKLQGEEPKTYEDFRVMLTKKDLDAVIIATPDHWHCLPMVTACEMGKDVYVEKPMANSIEECNIMVRAARKYRRIVQVGQQQRSSEVWKGAMEYLKTGKLGRVHRTNIWANFNYGLGPRKVPDSKVKPGVNYEFFLGPAPSRPFNEARFHGSWRFFWDYGGGLMTDWGVHLLDMGLLAKDLTGPPSKVMAYGSKMDLPDRARETHDTMTALFAYDDYVIQWEHNGGKQVGPYDQHYGVSFVGEHGTLVADRGKWQVLPEWDNTAKVHRIAEVGPVKGPNGHQAHPANFIDCIKSRSEPNCPVEIGRAVAVSAHMANIAVRTKQNKLIWDDTRNKFIGGKSANKFIAPKYRKPWKLPKVSPG